MELKPPECDLTELLSRASAYAEQAAYDEADRRHIPQEFVQWSRCPRNQVVKFLVYEHHNFEELMVDEPPRVTERTETRMLRDANTYCILHEGIPCTCRRCDETFGGVPIGR